jgi:acyl-CoA reductase-like NAD-dependent aldehyde dehydrogenase
VNDTECGLVAGIWISDVGRAHRVARVVRTGQVYVTAAEWVMESSCLSGTVAGAVTAGRRGLAPFGIARTRKTLVRGSADDRRAGSGAGTRVCWYGTSGRNGSVSTR